MAAGAEEPTRRGGSRSCWVLQVWGCRAVSPVCASLQVPPPCPHLNDSPAQPRHICQLLKRLCVGVVVLSKLCLHDLWEEGRGERGSDVAGESRPLQPPWPRCPTCSCSAVKEVRALLAGFGWLSCSEGTAPSSVIPLPTGEKPYEPQVTEIPTLLVGDTTAGGITAWDTRAAAGAERAEPALPLRSCPGLLSPPHTGGETTIPQEFTVGLRKMRQVVEAPGNEVRQQQEEGQGGV